MLAYNMFLTVISSAVYHTILHCYCLLNTAEWNVANLHLSE